MEYEGVTTATEHELQALGYKWLTELDQAEMNDAQDFFHSGLLTCASLSATPSCLHCRMASSNIFAEADCVDKNSFLMRVSNLCDDPRH